MTDLMPSGPSVWAYTPVANYLHTQMYKAYFSKSSNLPDVLMEMVGRKDDNHELTTFFLGRRYEKKVDKLRYKIYVKV